MIEHLYKSEEYMDELDNLENLADTLLQLIMDDGTVRIQVVIKNLALIPHRSSSK